MLLNKKRSCDFATCISTAIDSAAKVAEGGKAELYSHSHYNSGRYLYKHLDYGQTVGLQDKQRLEGIFCVLNKTPEKPVEGKSIIVFFVTRIRDPTLVSNSRPQNIPE